jgi:hypothetical protein
MQLAAMIAAVACDATAAAQSRPTDDAVPAKPTGCRPDERAAVLRELQQKVLKLARRRVDSLDRAILPGGPLAGWRLSHGFVVLAGAGAVALDNMTTNYPQPQLLLYAPSSTSSPKDWVDFRGPDGPYTLVGWGYLVPYQAGAKSPQRRCVAEHEWLVHEAGWHMMDGGMVLTPGATSEPARKPSAPTYFWHPSMWDLHIWMTSAGVPVISDANPDAPPGGLALPPGAFFHVVDGRHFPPHPPGR